MMRNLIRSMAVLGILIAAGAAGVVTSAREAGARLPINDGSTAACRRAPECATDADCDALCGPGLGKCVHSSCPVRVCHCH